MRSFSVANSSITGGRDQRLSLDRHIAQIVSEVGVFSVLDPRHVDDVLVERANQSEMLQNSAGGLPRGKPVIGQAIVSIRKCRAIPSRLQIQQS